MSEDQTQAVDQQQADDSTSVDDAQLGPSGEATLRKEREERKRLERELKAMRAQLSPEARQAAEERIRLAEEAALRAQEEADKKATTLRSKYEAQTQQLAKELEAAKKEHLQYRLRMDQQKIFQAAEGLDGVSADGRSFFDMFHALKGDAFAYDDNGQLIVVDADGEQLRDPETRLPVSPLDYVKSLQNDPVYGYLFRPAYGSGSGARSTRDGRALPGQKMDLKTTPKADLFAAGFGAR